MPAILITGGAGFVGLNLVEALLGRGEHVVVFGQEATLPAAAQSAFAGLKGRLEVLQGDVRDAKALAALFRGRVIDRVFPFAAITAGPQREAAAPDLILDVNLTAVFATLAAARDAGTVRRVVLPASSAVYGESAYDHAVLDEVTTPCRPISLYGVTKFAVERAGLRLAGLWGLDAVVARIGATYGPWERDTGLRDTLSPHLAIAQLAAAGGCAILPPAPLPAYDWIYVRDLAAGLLALLDAPAPAERIFNLASAQDWSPHAGACLDELAAAIPGFQWRHAGPGELPNVPFNETRPRGLMAIGRAAGLGWAPRFAPEAAYADYAAWLHRTGGVAGVA
ncbi:NAD-dependent epimerase/dehydratase family protein [Falsiroseomonas selenitidurans]|uniref:NAD(P)-dependent oxidoreductase n=1 Tax=Falsiroseomonas selenitidurans TaxID=2716335 RepID=A0ABX1E566_9PROT|nr:NAD(P)-dependent oxidoreductase [Falsiroseomonas selenitidurans]NKC30938.1 NAD(P)-dependent oxidoreductase [Falsiroseomonas selenitidurans]